MMLATWARVLARSSGYAFRSLGPLAKTADIIIVPQLPAGRRLLATAATAKKTVKKPATKKPTAATKKKATTRKKTTTKAAASKKKTVKKTSGRKVPARKKVVAKAPARKKKVLTPEQKLRLAIRDLKERALNPPTVRAQGSPWVQFLTEKHALLKASGQAGAKVRDSTRAWVQEYRNLSEAERKVLAEKTAKQKQVKLGDLQAWVARHSAAQIHDANTARTQLRRIQKENPGFRGISSLSFHAIPDARFPKKTRAPPIFYAMDFIKGATDKVAALKEAMRTWTTLPEAQKEKYQELAAKDHTRYESDLRAIGLKLTKKS